MDISQDTTLETLLTKTMNFGGVFNTTDNKFEIKIQNNWNYNSISFTDVENAMITGKNVRILKLTTNDQNLLISNELKNKGQTIKEFFETNINLENLKEDYERNEGKIGKLFLYSSFKKGVHFYNKSCKLKPLKSIPKKWNLKNVIQALHNNQAKAIQTGRFDGMQDMEVNIEPTTRDNQTVINDLSSDFGRGSKSFWYSKFTDNTGFCINSCCNSYHVEVSI